MSLKVPGQLTSAKEVVSNTGVPFDATARVLQQMAQQGLLRAEHGAHGGYSIIKDLSKVSLLELHDMILGPLDLVKCMQESADCELTSTCNIQSPIAALSRRLSDFYRSITLAELLRIKESPRSIAPESRVVDGSVI